MRNSDGYLGFERATRQLRWPPTIEVDLGQVPSEEEQGWLGLVVLWLSPVLLLLTFVGYIYLYVFAQNSNTQMMLMLFGIGGGAIAGFITQLRRTSKQRRERKTYLAKLENEREQLEQFVEKRAEALYALNPEPDMLLGIVRGRTNLWERLSTHPDFLELRLGIANKLKSEITLHSSAFKSTKLHPNQLEQQTLKLKEDFDYISEIPAIVSLKKVGTLGIAGDYRLRMGLVNTLIAELATLHSPEDVRVMAFYPEANASDWFWLGWLPHTHSLKQGIEFPMVAYEPKRIMQELDWLNKILNEREEKTKGFERDAQPANRTNLVVILDDCLELQNYQTIIKSLMTRGPQQNIMFIYLTTHPLDIPSTCLASLDIKSAREATMTIKDVSGAGETIELEPDKLATEQCDELARELAPIKLHEQSGAALPITVNLFDILKWRGSDMIGSNLAQHWGGHRAANLDVVLGISENGQPLVMNLDESKHGTHGMMVGRSGAGKGELLLNLVTNLTLNNHPDKVNFVLADFKGGATFAVFEKLPHCVGFVTDLEKGGELEIVRVIESLKTELGRREHLITSAQKKYGAGIQKIAQYQEMARDMPPLPYLMVVIDEFAKMKEIAPDRVQELAQIGMRGRSLGVFLLLAMQSPQGLIRGDMEANLRYRIALKVNNISDSTEVIRDKGAAETLTGEIAGRGFFRCDSSLVMFQSARVMGNALSQSGAGESANHNNLAKLGLNWKITRTNTFHALPDSTSNSAEQETRPDVEVLVQTVYDAIEQQPLAAPLHRPWLPPLASTLPMTQLLQSQGVIDSSDQFLGWKDPRPWNWMTLPVAKLDYFWEQQQPYLMANLSQRHLQFLGNSTSGRDSAMLATLVGLAATHRPDEMEFVLFDFGFSLKPLTGLPHNALYFTASEEDARRGTLEILQKEMARRRELYADVKKGVIINNLEDYRQYRRRVGAPGEELEAAIVIVVNNFSFWRRNPDYDLCAAAFRNILQAGATYGIHVILTADKPNDLEYGRYWESFTSVMLQMDSNDLIVTPQDKKMLALWNDKPGRGFVKGDPPRNLVEVQCICPVEGTEKEQARGVQSVVDSIFKYHEQLKPEQDLELKAVG